MDMPTGYKPPKFDIFDGTGDPHAHLRAYCDKLVGVGGNVKPRMKLFIRSLMEEALTWYTRQDPRNWRTWQDIEEDFMNRFRFNTEITPDRFALVNLQKKPSESFQEYARRWRSEVSRAQPLLDDSVLTKYFIRAQEGIYFEKMIGMMGQNFPEIVKMGDFSEESIKSSKVQSMVALEVASKAIQSGSIGSPKEEERGAKNGKAKMTDSAAAHGMTRSGRCYTPKDVNRGNPGREQIPRRNITDPEAAEFWK
nr:uncharacterized protein LOC104115320 [Nicotiana tomentosiformis]